MKNLYIVLFFLSTAIMLNAQEEYIFNQYFLNPATINPGASGFESEHTVLFNYRNTWAGFENSPKTFAAHYNGEIIDKVGIGATLTSDSYANLSTIRGAVSFAYMITGESYKIGAGLSTQFHQYGVDGVDLNSELVDNSDALLLQRLNDAQYFEASLGFHGEVANGLFFDLAFPGLVRSQINTPASSTGDESPATFNYLVGVGYPFKIMDYDMVIEPSIYFKQFRNVPLHVDFNALLKFLDGKLVSGVMFSNGADNRLGFLVGTKVNNLFFNYSYNISFHDSQQYNNGGHEIGLGLNFGQESMKKIDEN